MYSGSISKGIILPPGAERKNGIAMMALSDFNWQRYLLYWDEIIYPFIPGHVYGKGICDRGFYRQFADLGVLYNQYAQKRPVISLAPDLEFLQQEKILTVEAVNLGGEFKTKNGQLIVSPDLDPLSAAQEIIFNKYDLKEPGKYDLSQEIYYEPHYNSDLNLGIEFELNSLLPVPIKTIPFNDILEFKLNRSAEILAFRYYLDELYQSIIVAGDIPRKKNAVLNKLVHSLQNIDAVLKESKITSTQENLKGAIGGVFSSDLVSGSASVVATETILRYASHSFESSILAGIGGLSVQFFIKNIFSPKKSITLHPLTYIKSVNDEFIR